MENVFVEKPTAKDLEVYEPEELKHLEGTYNYCVTYLSNFNSFDIDTFRKVLGMCDEVMSQEIIDAIPSLSKDASIGAYERLYNLVINALKKEVNGRKIGDIIISKSLEDGKVFTIPELAYDCQIQYEQIGLSKLPRFSYIGGKSTFYGISDFNSQDILINGYSRQSRNTINRDPNRARAINLELLTVIRHEIQHAVQGKNYQNDTQNKNAMNAILDFEDYLRQNFDRTGLYHALHDSFPTEFDADIVSYEKTIKDLSSRYRNDYSQQMINYITELYNTRKSNYKDKPLDELVLYIFEMVEASNLPENKRVDLLIKVDNLQEGLNSTNELVTQSTMKK